MSQRGGNTGTRSVPNRNLPWSCTTTSVKRRGSTLGMSFIILKVMVRPNLCSRGCLVEANIRKDHCLPRSISRARCRFNHAKSPMTTSAFRTSTNHRHRALTPKNTRIGKYPLAGSRSGLGLHAWVLNGNFPDSRFTQVSGFECDVPTDT